MYLQKQTNKTKQKLSNFTRFLFSEKKISENTKNNGMTN